MENSSVQKKNGDENKKKVSHPPLREADPMPEEISSAGEAPTEGSEGSGSAYLSNRERESAQKLP